MKKLNKKTILNLGSSIALLSTSALAILGINSIFENKDINSNSNLDDALLKTVVSDYPATTGYISLASQFRHSVTTNEGWIGISQDSKSLIYTTFNGIRLWTKDMGATIYDAKFNSYDNTISVLIDSPDPTATEFKQFFIVTLLDLHGNTLSDFRTNLTRPGGIIDDAAHSPFSLKIVKDTVKNNLWTMVAVNPLAYRNSFTARYTHTNPGNELIKFLVSTKNVDGDWVTTNSSEDAIRANNNIHIWSGAGIVDAIAPFVENDVSGSLNMVFISDFQFFFLHNKIGVSTVLRATTSRNGTSKGSEAYYMSIHAFDEVNAPQINSWVQGTNGGTKSAGFDFNQSTNGIAGLGYSRFFPETSELLVPVRATFTSHRQPVAIARLRANDLIMPLNLLQDNYSDFLNPIAKRTMLPYSFYVSDPYNEVHKKIFSELALVNDVAIGTSGLNYKAALVSYDDKPFGNLLPQPKTIYIQNSQTVVTTDYDLPTSYYNDTGIPILTIPSKIPQRIGVGAMAFQSEPSIDSISTNYGTGGRIVSYGDYQRLMESSNVLEKSVSSVTVDDLKVLTANNILTGPDSQKFGLINTPGQNTITISILSRDEATKTITAKIVWNSKLKWYHADLKEFPFEYSETIVITGFSKLVPIFKTRAWDVFSIKHISGNTKDMDIATEIRSGQSDMANSFELRFGFKTSDGTTIDLGSGGKNGFYTAEGIKAISAAGQGSEITEFSNLNLYVRMFAKEQEVENFTTYDKQEYYLLNYQTSLINSTVPPQTDIDNSNLNFNSELFRPLGTENVNTLYDLEYFTNIPDNWSELWGFKSKIIIPNINLEVVENVAKLANDKGIFLYFLDKNDQKVRITHNSTTITPDILDHKTSGPYLRIVLENPTYPGSTKKPFLPPSVGTNKSVEITETVVNLTNGYIGYGGFYTLNFRGNTNAITSSTNHFVQLPEWVRPLLRIEFAVGPDLDNLLIPFTHTGSAFQQAVANYPNDFTIDNFTVWTRMNVTTPDYPDAEYNGSDGLFQYQNGIKYSWDYQITKYFNHITGFTGYSFNSNISPISLRQTINEDYFKTLSAIANDPLQPSLYTLSDSLGVFSPENLPPGVKMMWGETNTSVVNEITSFSNPIESISGQIFIRLEVRDLIIYFLSNNSNVTSIIEFIENNDELFIDLRLNFSGNINGKGKFNIRLSDLDDSASNNENILGTNQWFEYQVWGLDKTLKVAWTKEENSIWNLENGDKIEWKLVNNNATLGEDLYNTIRDGQLFKVVQVIDNIEIEVKIGKGDSLIDNPNILNKPQYPENSGWLVSGLKVEIILSEEEINSLELKINSFKPTFSGLNGLGEMYSNILNDDSIPKNIKLAWFTTNSQGIQTEIINFKKANLSNGDKVWVTIVPIDNNYIIPSSDILTSKVFIVSKLIVNESNDSNHPKWLILLLSIILLTTIFTVFIGLIWLIISIWKK